MASDDPAGKTTTTEGGKPRHRSLRARGTWPGWNEYAGLKQFRPKLAAKSPEEHDVDSAQAKRLEEAIRDQKKTHR